jgi:hypothetical protein
MIIAVFRKRPRCILLIIITTQVVCCRLYNRNISLFCALRKLPSSAPRVLTVDFAPSSSSFLRHFHPRQTLSHLRMT